MKLYKIYFSPTGGTKKVIDVISKPWNCEKIELDLTNKKTNFANIKLQKEDICMVAVPSFGGRVPEVVISKLKKITGAQARAILITVYGNRAYDDTLLELKNTLQELNFRCTAAIAAIAEHSIMHEFGTGRPDEKDTKELLEYAVKIKESMEKQTSEQIQVEVPGNNTYREYTGVPLKPKANKTCSKCGLCAIECPVDAIPKDTPSLTDKNKCISCMRCMKVCPKHARELNKMMVMVAAKKMKKVCISRKSNELFLQ